MAVVIDKPVADFEAQATSGQTFSLAALKGKQVVIYFYPKDSTPGCTTEGQGFRDQYAAFKAANTEVFGVSRDSVKSHENFKGKQVVIYFYPKDSTPGCTTQGQGFRDQYAAFKAANTEVFGISRDSLKSHENFKGKQEFPFELISDKDEAVCQLFDVIKLKKLYGKEYLGVDRSTFLIDKDGVLRQEWRGVKVPGHVDAVLAAAQDLNKA